MPLERQGLTSSECREEGYGKNCCHHKEYPNDGTGLGAKWRQSSRYDEGDYESSAEQADKNVSLPDRQKLLQSLGLLGLAQV